MPHRTTPDTRVSKAATRDVVVPMPLVRLSEPFNDPDWIFEIKYDGFRALARIERGRCTLVSRNGHVFRRFESLARQLAGGLPAGDALLDGEIVCLDDDGRSQFNPLMFRRGAPVFAAFDLLAANGSDLRDRPLVERKRRLRDVVHCRPSPLLLVQHVVGCGVALFDAARENDVEGVVGKWARGRYLTDGTTTSWVKIKNPDYSQMRGRRELFERRRGDRSRTRAATRRWVLA